MKNTAFPIHTDNEARLPYFVFSLGLDYAQEPRGRGEVHRGPAPDAVFGRRRVADHPRATRLEAHPRHRVQVLDRTRDAEQRRGHDPPRYPFVDRRRLRQRHSRRAPGDRDLDCQARRRFSPDGLPSRGRREATRPRRVVP